MLKQLICQNINLLLLFLFLLPDTKMKVTMLLNLWRAAGKTCRKKKPGGIKIDILAIFVS